MKRDMAKKAQKKKSDFFVEVNGVGVPTKELKGKVQPSPARAKPKEVAQTPQKAPV